MNEQLDIYVIINRVKCGLPITKEQGKQLEEFVEIKKREDVKFMILLFLAVSVITLILSYLHR